MFGFILALSMAAHADLDTNIAELQKLHAEAAVSEGRAQAIFKSALSNPSDPAVEAEFEEALQQIMGLRENSRIAELSFEIYSEGLNASESEAKKIGTNWFSTSKFPTGNVELVPLKTLIKNKYFDLKTAELLAKAAARSDELGLMVRVQLSFTDFGRDVGQVLRRSNSRRELVEKLAVGFKGQLTARDKRKAERGYAGESIADGFDAVIQGLTASVDPKDEAALASDLIEVYDRVPEARAVLLTNLAQLKTNAIESRIRAAAASENAALANAARYAIETSADPIFSLEAEAIIRSIKDKRFVRKTDFRTVNAAFSRLKTDMNKARQENATATEKFLASKARNIILEMIDAKNSAVRENAAVSLRASLFTKEEVDALLPKLVKDPAPGVRWVVAYIIEMQFNDAAHEPLLRELEFDADPKNVKIAKEALARQGVPMSPRRCRALFR